MGKVASYRERGLGGKLLVTGKKMVGGKVARYRGKDCWGWLLERKRRSGKEPSYREKEGWGRLLHTGEEKVGEGCSLQGKSGLGEGC